MDKFDITFAMLSMTQMGNILYDNTEKGRAAVRTGNEYGARVRSEHPKRFGLYAGVPLPDIDGVMAEIEYGFDTLRADAIGIYTNDNQNRWPGDPYFDPMWQELNRRNAVLYIHPLAPRCCTNLNDSVSPVMNEFDFDITRACTSILVNGVAAQIPERQNDHFALRRHHADDRRPHQGSLPPRPQTRRIHPQRSHRRTSEVFISISPTPPIPIP